MSVAGAPILNCSSILAPVGSRSITKHYRTVLHQMDAALRTRTLLCLSLASLLHLAWATCKASNLLQLPLGTLGALEGGRDSHGKADAISLSSPEFSALLPKLDAKMEPLTAFRMKGDLDC